jgi:hypothetical protein
VIGQFSPVLRDTTGEILTYTIQWVYYPAMSTEPSIVGILSRADVELRRAIEELLGQKRYSEAVVAARVADAVARLLLDVEGQAGESESEHFSDGRANLRDSSSLNSPRSLQARRQVRELPRFERDGDRLIKIAWSKRNRSEYEHRAPRVVVQLLVSAIKKKKGEGVLFAAADVLPLKDPDSRQELPSYQSYLALAWLQHTEVIRKKGREGYVLKPATATPEHLAELWEALPANA